MKLLSKSDPQVAKLSAAEEARQKDVLEMIPSENYTSRSVLEALGTVLNNKYSEGYPKRRYYQGNQVADEVEMLAIERAKKLFGVPYVNVQALSGSVMNYAVYMALLKPNDKIMGLSLKFGGHLTHGAPLTLADRFFTPVNYELGSDARLNYAAIAAQAKKEKPELIVCGFTAYPRVFDFKKFGEIADSVGAYLLADISHIAGLVVGGAHPSPVSHVHVVTTTTHKTLRGPRGALIMVTKKGLKKDPDLGKKIDSAIIPGLQGGPHDNQTAAIAVALKEASASKFTSYAAQIVKNSKALSEELNTMEYKLVSGGSDNHLILIDLTNKGVNGAVAALALEYAGIVINKNGVPFDTMPPFYPSGIRMGTPAITTRGMKERDMKRVAEWMNRAIEEVRHFDMPRIKEERSVWMKTKVRSFIAANKKLKQIAGEVKSYMKKFPVP